MINLKRYSLLVYMLLISLLIVSPVQSATILSENFEGAFPGSWTVGDSNSNDGSDYWDDTSYNAHLGSWDISGMFTDTDGGTSAWTTQNDVIIVSNNQPSLSGVPDKNTDEDTTPPDNWIDLYSYASDTEDGDSFMTYAIISETNSSLIDCSIDSNRYVDCGTPAQDQYGYSDITVQVDDSDGGSNTDTFRVTVNSVNDAPVLTGIPDKSTDEDVTPPDNFIYRLSIKLFVD